MRCDLLDYELPRELLATHPAPRRDGAKLLVVETASHRHLTVADLPELVPEGAVVVLNDTRVIPARLFGHKRGTGGRVELLLVRRVGPAADAPGMVERWRALGRASKGLRPGTTVEVEGGRLVATVVPAEPSGAERDGDGGGPGLVEVSLAPTSRERVSDAIERSGHVPLPPYVGRADEPLDRERYQTVYARVPGAVAAPTAGLHLTDALLARLSERCTVAMVTLHVGVGTFQPVTVDELDDHPMHEERFEVPEATVRAIANGRERGAPVVAVGTTVVRALESAADERGALGTRVGDTRLLIQPGYRFRVVDRLLTNFHLPRSTLLALVYAFAGRDRVRAAYDEAIRARYRFYSYGDAMWLAREDSP